MAYGIISTARGDLLISFSNMWLRQGSRRFGIVVSVLATINEVNLRRVRFVLGWVTSPGFNSRCRKPISVITSHLGQLSLAIPPWAGSVSTSQRAVMLCGWEVKAGMVCEWVAGKTVWSPCYHGPYLSALEMNFPIIRRYTNRPYFTF